MIGFDETPPWGTAPSMRSGEKSSAWNQYRRRIRDFWTPHERHMMLEE